MTVPKHIGLAGRKALLAKLIAFETLERHAPGSGRPGPTRIVDEMIDVGNRAIDDQDHADPLDEWLRQAVTTAGTVTVSVLKRELEAPAQTMLGELAIKAAAVSCAECSPRRICNGSDRDDAIVAGGGWCMRHVRDIFATADAVAQAYYRHYVSGFATPPRLVLSTSEAASKPHDIPAPIYLSGVTGYADTSRGPISTVEFQIALKSLDWQSWLTALYVFLHELVCHAYAGTAPPHRGRKGLYTYDPFAEGWMDRICYMILQDIGDGASPAFPAAQELPFRAAQRDAGQLFHLQRAQPQRDHGKKAPSVAHSIRAAELAFSALQRAIEPAAQAHEAMYRVSLGLNLLDKPVSERTRLLVVLERDLADRASARWGWTIRLFKQYLNHGNADRLWTELLAA
jgi:hypothetical protein